MQLEELSLPSFLQPLPQLPALRKFHSNISDLQLLSSVMATLKELTLEGDSCDFQLLTRFTRLNFLDVSFDHYDNLIASCLPRTLRKICLRIPTPSSTELQFPAGGQVCLLNHTLWWTRTKKALRPIAQQTA